MVKVEDCVSEIKRRKGRLKVLNTMKMTSVVSKFVGPVGQSDISNECPTKNVGSAGPNVQSMPITSVRRS